MKREYFTVTLFFLITAIFFYLFYQIIVPFFVPIAWAGVFVILFHPLYKKLSARLHSPNLAGVLMCILIIVLIIGPVAYLFAALVNEAAAAVAKVNAMYKAGELDNLLQFNIPWLEAVKQKLSQYYDLSKINLNQLVKDALDKTSGIIFSQTSWLIANGTRAIFYFILMIFTMFYFFRDGEMLINRIKRLMPIAREQVDAAFSKLRDVIYATMYGGVVVALIQGLLGGILFTVMGIPSAIFWGAIMAFLAIIPLLGAFIVYVPAGIILMIGGAWVKGLLVIAIGTVVISQSDNVIRPLLIAGRTEMHPLMLFFSIMGGVAMFGLLGVVVGPIIAAIFTVLIKLFESRLHPAEEAPDPADDSLSPPDTASEEA